MRKTIFDTIEITTPDSYCVELKIWQNAENRDYANFDKAELLDFIIHLIGLYRDMEN